MDAEPVVFLVCGNSKARRQLETRLKECRYQVEAFSSLEAFRARAFAAESGCLLLFLSDSDNDLEWLSTAGQPDDHWPVVAVAADADVDAAVQSMKKGAFDFLLESCSDQRLATAIDEALRWDAFCRRQISAVQAARRRLEKLTPDLREVLDLLMRGRKNREIAAAMQLSQRAIEDRRGKIMRAMKAQSVVALVRQVLLAEGTAPPPCREQRPGRSNQTVVIADQEDAESLAATLFIHSSAKPRRTPALSRRSGPVRGEGSAPAKARRDLANEYRDHDRQAKRAR